MPPADGARNYALGVDSTLRLGGHDDLELSWAQSFDRRPGEKIVSGSEASRFSAALHRRTREGWGYSALAGWSGPDFAPELGFVARESFYRIGGELRHGRLGSGEQSYRRRTNWLGGNAFWAYQDRRLESADASGFR